VEQIKRTKNLRFSSPYSGKGGERRERWPVHSPDHTGDNHNQQLKAEQTGSPEVSWQTEERKHDESV
jgi:hypothetical protein